MPLYDRQLVSIYKNFAMVTAEGPPNWNQDRPDARPQIKELLKPIFSIIPEYSNILRNGVLAANLPPVQSTIIGCLLTVIAQAAAGNGSDTVALFRDTNVGTRTINGVMAVREFMTLNPREQLAAIDQAWNKVCTKKQYNCFTSSMFEPTEPIVPLGKKPLPSGVIPTQGGGLALGYVDSNGIPNAFTDLRVGFRTDGCGDNCQRDIDRVLDEGMTTQLKNLYLMQNIKGWEVQGTVVHRDTAAPRVWTTKDDLFNESAVCVARNLFGATAFPTREFIGPAVLWAVDVSGLVGFDTEEHQKSLNGNRQWRPGEKAYYSIPPANVIGYVRMEKLGTSSQGGWSFKIPANAAWTYRRGWQPPILESGGRETKVRKYITDQLNAWRGEHTIDGAYDFA